MVINKKVKPFFSKCRIEVCNFFCLRTGFGIVTGPEKLLSDLHLLRSRGWYSRFWVQIIFQWNIVLLWAGSLLTDVSLHLASVYHLIEIFPSHYLIPRTRWGRRLWKLGFLSYYRCFDICWCNNFFYTLYDLSWMPLGWWPLCRRCDTCHKGIMKLWDKARLDSYTGSVCQHLSGYISPRMWGRILNKCT